MHKCGIMKNNQGAWSPFGAQHTSLINHKLYFYRIVLLFAENGGRDVDFNRVNKFISMHDFDDFIKFYVCFCAHHLIYNKICR